MTPDFLDALILAAGMTAFAEDCDRPVFAKRSAAGTDDQPQALDTLDRHTLAL